MAHHNTPFHHTFDRVCGEQEIEHRLTTIKHPWTDSQVERMNRTIKEAAVKRYHYDCHAQLTARLHDFINAYPLWSAYEDTARSQTLRINEPQRFSLNPQDQMQGPNTRARCI